MPDSAENAPKTCFVAMPITPSAFYVERFGDPEHFVHVLDHLFTPALEAAGLKVIPPNSNSIDMIRGEIIRNLEQADFVLCDLSDLNPNVFFELGVRTSLDRPVILVRDSLTSRIPFDVGGVNAITYDSSLTPWSLLSEVTKLTKFIQEAVKGSNSGNAMWHYFGLTKRASPTEAGVNSVDEKLSLIINELTQGIGRGRVLPRTMKEVQVESSFLIELQPVMRAHGIAEFGVTVTTSEKDSLILDIAVPGNRDLRDAFFRDATAAVKRVGGPNVKLRWVVES